MENQRDSKVPNLKSSGGVISPINVPNFVCYHPSPLSPIFDPYASDSSDSTSPLMKCLCSAAPALAATLPSSPVFEVDILVMDGTLVPKSNKGGRVRVKATMTSWNLNSTSSQPGGVRAENSNSKKAEICRHWEDLVYAAMIPNASLHTARRRLLVSGKNRLEISSNRTTVPVDQAHHHVAGKAVQLTKSSSPPPQ